VACRRSDANIAWLNIELTKLGIPAIHSVTPEGDYDNAGLAASRMGEIEAWLASHQGVTAWVALDDLNLEKSNKNGAHKGKFVCTNREKGLTQYGSLASADGSTQA